MEARLVHSGVPICPLSWQPSFIGIPNMLPTLTVNRSFLHDFMDAELPCGALGLFGSPGALSNGNSIRCRSTTGGSSE